MRARLCLAIVLLWFGAHPVLAAPQAAVLVGVGKYHPDSIRSMNEPLDLKGPPNDLVLMQDLLVHYGFRESEMLVLADEQAGRDAIIKAVADRLLTLPPESLAVFYFSGHGSSVRGATANEDNDETIVPYDGRIRGEPVRDILDDQIYGWITELERKRIRAVFILDSCLSGGAPRTGLELRRLKTAVSAASVPATDRKLNLRVDAGFDRATPVVVVTASSHQENAYGQIDGASGTYRGVFTNALHRLLLPADASVQPKTWLGVVDALRNRLKPEITGTPKQTPQAFGMHGAEVFGSGKPFSHAIRARPIAPGSVELVDAGALTGITVGSVFKLFGPNSIPWRSSKEFEAKAKVTRVFDRSATLDVVEGTLVSNELYAVEFEYALPDTRLGLGLPPGTGLGATDRRALTGALSELGEIVEDPARAELLLTAVGGWLQLTTAAGSSVGTPFELGGAAAMRADLRERLSDYVRWQRLLAWRRVAVRPTGLKISLEYEAGGKTVALQDGSLARAQILAGARINLRVRNFGLQRVQAHALLLRQDFTVDVCPLGIVERNAPSATESVTLGSGAGLAGFKLIVSDPEQAVDFAYLHSRAVTRAPRSPLETELAGLWRGAASGGKRRGAGGATFEWHTVEIPFTVTAAPADAPREAVRRCVGIPQ